MLKNKNLRYTSTLSGAFVRCVVTVRLDNPVSAAITVLVIFFGLPPVATNISFSFSNRSLVSAISLRLRSWSFRLPFVAEFLGTFFARTFPRLEGSVTNFLKQLVFHRLDASNHHCRFYSLF